MACKMLFFDYRESEEEFFKTHNFENFDIKFFKESLNEETLEFLTEDDFESAMIISVFITSQVSENVISRFKNLRVISTRSTGYDHICLNTCADKNIALINVEAYGNTAVAQFTMALLLMSVRNLYRAVTSQKGTNPRYGDFCGSDLNDLTLGVVGTGAIGSAVCRYAHAFGMNILAVDLREKSELINDYGVKYTDFETLLKMSDIVTVHVPYTKENYHLFDYKQFEMMKNCSYFINVSRGELVNTEALYEYAKNGKLNGAALDVVACPEDENGGINKSDVTCIETSQTVKNLSQLSNVILTPHMAYDTKQAVDYILKTTFEGLTDYLTGGRNHRVI